MGWNGSDSVTNPRKGNQATQKFSFWRGLLAAFIVVCCAGACCWFFFSGDDGLLPKEAKSKKTARIAVMNPDLRYAEEPQSFADRQNDATASIESALDPNFPYTDGRKVVRSTTNSWGQVIDRCIMPNGKRRKVIRNLRKPIFSHVTDDVLLMALVGGGDEPGPPIPFDENMEEAFLASLDDPIVISKDDSDDVIRAKTLVIEGRRNMAELIAQGESFFDALNDHLAVQGDNASAREQVMSSVLELKESGESDMIDDYLNEANEVLENLGARPVLIEDVLGDEE